MSQQYKINLHAHSNFSDGSNTIFEMAKEYKRQGFTCAVITDHVYSIDKPASGNRRWSLNLASWIEALRARDTARLHLDDYPIVLGAEFSIDKAEECVVIGQDAVTYLMILREQRRLLKKSTMITIKDLEFIKKKFKCIISLCHPSLNGYEKQNDSCRFFELKGHYVLDCFEMINSGARWFGTREDKRECPKELSWQKQISSSDAHSTSCIDRAYMLVDKNLTSENDIIHYFKDKKSNVELYSLFETQDWIDQSLSIIANQTESESISSSSRDTFIQGFKTGEIQG
jgi:hypothetical protein